MLKNIGPLDSEKNSLALKYAYIYFILKQIPLLYINFNEINQLIPDNNRFIDFQCEKIIHGGDFI